MIRLVRHRCRYSAVTDLTEQRPLMPTERVAELLGCSPDTVRRFVREGRLPAVQFGRFAPLRFRPEDVEKLLEPNVGQAA